MYQTLTHCHTHVLACRAPLTLTTVLSLPSVLSAVSQSPKASFGALGPTPPGAPPERLELTLPFVLGRDLIVLPAGFSASWAALRSDARDLGLPLVIAEPETGCLDPGQELGVRSGGPRTTAEARGSTLTPTPIPVKVPVTFMTSSPQPRSQ